MKHTLISKVPLSKPGEELLFLKEKKLRLIQDILFFIHYEATKLMKPVLKFYHIGHAHHRLIQFICNYPGISIGEVRTLLGITKQSLNRVLNELVKLNYVEINIDQNDKRKKRLYLTKKGQIIEHKLFLIPRQQFLRAFKDPQNNNHIEGFQQILYSMLNSDDKNLLNHCHYPS
ncbi:MarR family transcriptional regulator [Commensalibacter sp. Nvir]|uniref:MarR family winged helix-turn-helix transcriptional regulator n=1 Tax=Commensalibacter sp. Nvir TaxID=3069817 RepID=UPI0030C81EB2